MVAVLFARRDSVYKAIPDCDVWDADRDALQWPGGAQVVAHPPCRGWGRLRHFARPAPGELDMGRWAVRQVQAWGGVLEHPAGSGLWPAMNLPNPGGGADMAGGHSMAILQHWWGHRAEKPTWLYIVGVSGRRMPPFSMVLGGSSHVIETRKKGPDRRPSVTKAEREHTPPLLAEWLCEVARRAAR